MLLCAVVIYVLRLSCSTGTYALYILYPSWFMIDFVDSYVILLYCIAVLYVYICIGSVINSTYQGTVSVLTALSGGEGVVLRVELHPYRIEILYSYISTRSV